MKNLKMFAIGLAAFAAMTMGVHATGSVNSGADGCVIPGDDAYSTGTKCVVKAADKYYNNFKAGWDYVKTLDEGGVITLLSSTNAGFTATERVTKNITIDLGVYDLTVEKNISVNDEVTLKITGTGKLTATDTAGVAAFAVSSKGSFVTEGKLELATTTCGDLIRVHDAKEITIGDGATLTAKTNVITLFNSGDAKITLNANVGTRTVPATVTLVNLTDYDNARLAETKVIIEGGSYYTTGNTLSIAKGIDVTVNNGTFAATAGNVFNYDEGTLVVNNGTFQSEGAYSAVLVPNSAKEGSITINNGTFTNKGTSYALSLQSNEVTYKVTNGTFEGGKNAQGKRLPAIYILDEKLTGLVKDGEADKFAGILTGGKYLTAIVGEAKVEDTKYTAEQVVNHIVAAGATITDEGNYKVINAKVEEQDPNAGDANTPSDTTNPNVPNVPKTSDSILVYAGLGIVSALSVGFASRRKENN